MRLISVKPKLILWLFGIILLIDLTGILLDAEKVHFIAKLLLMPLLIAYLFASVPFMYLAKIKFIFIGLSLAWFGDLFLLMDEKQPIFFIIGLLFFLATHICYILFFRRLFNANTTTWKNQYVQIGFTSLYGLALIALLFPHLGEMKIPVIIYATCITAMFIYTLRLRDVIAVLPWKWLLTGAGLFVLSDSILAINKFYHPFTSGPVLIMLTYGLAQAAISFGTSRLFDKKFDAMQVPEE